MLLRACWHNTVDIGAQNLNFASKFTQNGDFHPKILYFGEKIRIRTNFPTG